MNAPLAEAFDEGEPVGVGVRVELEVRGDQAAQVVAEGDADRRAVVDRPDAHLQDALRALRGLVGQPVRQIRRQLAGAKHARALGRDAIEIRRPRAVDLQECTEHRRHHGAALVRFVFEIQDVHVRLEGAPFPGRGIDRAQGIAKRRSTPRGLPNCCASWPSRFSAARSPRVRLIWSRNTPG